MEITKIERAQTHEAIDLIWTIYEKPYSQKRRLSA